MAEPFVGEIRMFAGNFAPRGWSYCDGQLLAVSQNDALFSLLGTIYGGDGRTTFGLPDLRGRLPIHAGSGPGLSPRRLGAKSGMEKVTLATTQLPSHTHAPAATAAVANQGTPSTARVLAQAGTISAYQSGNPSTTVAMNTNSVSKIGGGRDHTNLMPFECVHFIIALFGIYPSRT